MTQDNQRITPTGAYTHTQTQKHSENKMSLAPSIGQVEAQKIKRTNTHACTRVRARARKVKPGILLEQQTVSGSGISWAICKSAPRSRQITTPALHYSSFLQARCPSCRPTNSVKALKAQKARKKHKI